MEETFVYLGVRFGASGVVGSRSNLEELLHLVDRGPLKPQQKVEVVRTHVVPGLIHQAVLGAEERDWWSKADVMLRAKIRAWLRLPHDSCNAFFYAAIRDGGLGLIELLKDIPIMRGARRAKVEASLNVGADTSDVRRAEEEKDERKRTKRDNLLRSVDCADLRHIRRIKDSTAWLRSSADDISGREFLQFVRIWSGSLPTRIRTTRGRRVEGVGVCRGGCGVDETAAHVLERCRTIRGNHRARHHAVVKLLSEAFHRRGFTVFHEEEVRLEGTRLRPDLIVVRRNEGVVVDVQVVTGFMDIRDLNENKRAKYSGGDFLSAVSQLTNVGVNNVRVVPVTLTWKGVWCNNSHKELREIGVRGKILEYINFCVLRGSSMCWRMFNRELNGQE